MCENAINAAFENVPLKGVVPRKRKIKWQTLYIKSAIVQIIEGNIKSLMEHDAP